MNSIDKYIKYKQKYLRIKQNDKNIMINEKLNLSDAEYHDRYLKYKKKYIELSGGFSLFGSKKSLIYNSEELTKVKDILKKQLKHINEFINQLNIYIKNLDLKLEKDAMNIKTTTYMNELELFKKQLDEQTKSLKYIDIFIKPPHAK